MKAMKKHIDIIRKWLAIALVLMLLMFAACSPAATETSLSPPPSPPDDSAGLTTTPSSANSGGPSDVRDDDDSWRISVIGPDGKTLSFSEADLKAVLDGQDAPPSGLAGQFTHVYSTVNNWPTARFYAADGYGVASILFAAELYDTAQTVTFRANDGYEISLTREQLLAPQYFFPNVFENDNGAEQVYPIIAYRWREGSNDIESVRDENPCLIFGQRHYSEQTNPAFVENISEIIISTEPGQAWEAASTFPSPGPIAFGETVKLQHPYYGLVKLYYTLDGSEPTMQSALYNPSTYQPELNVPIPVAEPVVIKVLVCGYGRPDSEIAVFEFTPIP